MKTSGMWQKLLLSLTSKCIYSLSVFFFLLGQLKGNNTVNISRFCSWEQRGLPKTSCAARFICRIKKINCLVKWKSDWGLSVCFNCVAGVLRIRLSIVRSSVGDKLWCPLITDASHMRTVDISLWAASLAGWWRSGYMNLLRNRSSAPCVNMDSLCNICKGARIEKKNKTVGHRSPCDAAAASQTYADNLTAKLNVLEMSLKVTLRGQNSSVGELVHT